MGQSNSNIPTGLPTAPPTEYVCIIPEISYTAEDNETYINYSEVTLSRCVNIPLNENPDWFNCNLCGSDERYEQPVIDGDIMRIQVPIINNTYLSYKAYLFDGDDNVIEDTGGIEQFEVWDGFRNRFLNIKLTVTNIPATCFHVRLFAFESEIDEGDLATCIAARLLDGKGPKEADLLCRIEQSEDNDVFYSELYRKTNDECEDTLLIEGEWPYYSCDRDGFYGSPQIGSDRHELRIRIPGNIEISDFNFEETVIFNTKRTSKRTAVYLLRSQKLPLYVAQQLASIFSSKSITIDGVEYAGALKISKSFDEGRMWIVNTTLKRECDEIDFLC